MKYTCLLLSLIFVLPVVGQHGYKKLNNGVIVTLPKAGASGQTRTVRLSVVNDEIIQVTATPGASIKSKQSLIRVAPASTKAEWSTTQSGDLLSLSTAKVRATVSLTTGEVAFYEASGGLILKEAAQGRMFEPITVAGDQGFSVVQKFDSPDDEAFYGLGQHQSDEFNWKGRSEELFQYNTKISVPFLVSTRNYGLLFDNYSMSRFGDERPYENLDIFKLYDKKGQEGGITASYYRNGGADLFVERKESSIDYETYFTHGTLPKNFDFKGETYNRFPAGFSFPNSLVVWEGEIEPRESGLFYFKLLYGSYTKVYLDNELVVDERWRPSWNPNSVKFSSQMTAGKRVPLRIEWKDGNGSYIGLKALSPRPEEEVNKISFWSELGDDLDYYFIYGESMDKIISGYRYLTGKAPIMPAWAMGFWQSREKYATQSELLNALQELRARKFGVDNMVQDWHYWRTDDWGSHEFEPSRFPNPKGMIDTLHAHNAKLMISVWPKFYVTTEHFKELDRNGWMFRQSVNDSLLDFVSPGYKFSFYDAYSPGGRKLFWKQMDEHLYSLGVDAWWMDASEPNLKDCLPHIYQKALVGPNALGSGARYYNTYALVNAQAIWEGQRSKNPNDRVFLLTRNGFAGLQRYSTASWSGDIGTRWEELKAQIPAGLNYSISGIPYWTMDIGGFCVENRYIRAQRIYDASGLENDDLKEWRELQARWHQFGAFTPLYRAHGQFPLREIYNIAPESHPAYKTIYYYNKLRYALMPYIYSLAAKTWFDDYTIMRPLVMDYPKDVIVRNISTQYMFGPSLMACPVYKYKTVTRSVYFPSGVNWYDFYDGKLYRGGSEEEISAQYERMPLFVPEGSILFFGSDVNYIGETKPDVIDVYVYAGNSASLYLYEDEGVNYNYEKGIYSKINFEYDDISKSLTLSDRGGSPYTNMTTKRKFNIYYIKPGKKAGRDNLSAPDAVIEYIGKKQIVKLP